MRQLESLMQRLRRSPVIATIVVTALTLVLVGGVVLTMTSAGCGPANALGLKALANRCGTGHPTAAKPSPSPSPYPTPTAFETPSPVYPSPPAPPPVSPPNPPVGGPGSPAYPDVVDASPGSGHFPTGLSCRLPVYVGQSGSGGFIVFPGGDFIADPSSGVTYPSPSPGTPTPSPAPPGYGPPGPNAFSYDRTYSRWVPVSRQGLSADGTRYAFTQAEGIYVVTVSNGDVTELGDGRPWFILSVGTTGVYATVPNSAGLWLLPFSGASPREIITTGYWQAVGGGAAYGTSTSAVPQGTANTIQRLDLSTNAITNYFTRTGAQSQVSGFDGQGTPVIYVNGNNVTEVWIGAGLFLIEWRNVPYSGQYGFQPNGPPVPDVHGLWFSGYVSYGGNSGGQSIVLYIPGSGLYAVSSLGVQLGGGCN
jgi:hypothetical protein